MLMLGRRCRTPLKMGLKEIHVITLISTYFLNAPSTLWVLDQTFTAGFGISAHITNCKMKTIKMLSIYNVYVLTVKKCNSIHFHRQHSLF